MRNNLLLFILLLLLASCYSDRSRNTVTDIDGNIYRTITIGDQVWMADNLRVSCYRNGDKIPVVTEDTAWSRLSSGASCYYNNDEKNNTSYGRLYNWHVINDNRGIAPEGWHIPTEEEIETLVGFLQGDTIAGSNMKASSGWLIPDKRAINKSGFSALPGGYRFDKGSYHTMGSNGYWWSRARSFEVYAWSPRLYTGFADVDREPWYQQYGFAVRCIKDQPAKRIAKEEQEVEGFDHSLNRISKAHHAFPDIDGGGLVVSLKEDLFDVTDIDYKNRYLPVSLAADKTSAHAGMMATLIAGGGNSYYKGRGVAKGATLTSSSFKNLMADPDDFYIGNNITVQSHSYGTDIENFYGDDAFSYDKNVFQQPHIVHVFSSGNSGASAGNTGVYKDIQGFANLTGSFKMAKNNIVVSAIDSFGNSIDYISRGPAYDGRLKPELAACTNGGSSGAAALVSGSALLVQQLYKKKFNDLPDASLVKAVLINSADDAGAKGIDFKTGYGSLNLYKALTAVQDGQFFSGTVQSNNTQTFTITIPANTKDLKMTVTWTDPPAAVNSSTALINDLDMTVTHASGKEWLPWVLSSFPQQDSLEQAAVRKQDHLNNTEQISIEDPSSGNYEIKVSGHGMQGVQSFHIAWQYEKKNEFSWDYPVAIDNLVPAESNILRWQNSFDGTGTLQWSANGSEWQSIEAQTDLSKNYTLWSVPDTVTTAQLRMVIGSRIFLGDMFTISKPISFQLRSDCMDSVRLFWNKQKNISSYRVYQLGSKYLEPIATISDTMISLRGTGLAAAYFSIAPVLGAGREGVRTSSRKHEDRGLACADKEEYLLYPNPVLQNGVIRLASPGRANEILQVYAIDGRQILRYRLTGAISSIPAKGLSRGMYIYNIVSRGTCKYSGRFIIH